MSDDRVLHELGNILAVIAGQAEFLLHQERGADPAETRQSLEAIHNAALRGRDKLSRARGHRTTSTAETRRSAIENLAALRILVVDDEDEVRDALAGLLRQAGHRVDTAPTGEDALAHSGRERFDCIITDLALSGLNGLTLCRVIKDRTPGTFVVLMTGSSEQFEPAMVRAAGVDRLLFKPSGREQILAAIAECRPPD
jgi:CheY-like chemotaxis protein